ncbi:amphiphysin L homeolog isoform X9 [Xenopus laevis]|uniref:Amphiphysin n=1 Tax=Xenopus laevis TaxID=8355 RepID=A0A8J1KVL4_XENLA|nr:amphiphysin L homeolog isoform X9 [Xenopus laevis]
MADMKTGIFAKNVQKRLSRAQEKVLQKLGKADETKDEQFEEYVQNFKRQETEGTRLQREMRAYLAAIKGMQEASLKLSESLHEVYEPDWYGRDDVKTVGEKCDTLWEDFHQKLVDGALITLDTYLGQFPDIKNRIAKRSRKLVDYDSARHHLEALQNAKRKDEGRISKAEEEFQKAQKVFEDFNIDLQEELPSLWSRRIGFYVNTFQNVSGLEAKFHKEITVLCHKLYEVMTKLGEQHADNAFTIQGAPSDSGPLRIAKTPSPPEEVPQEASPLASPNHTLAPVSSPAPARPKSPSQLRKGPPVPPLPKLTPSKELQQENIISFFEDNFVPEINVTTPSQNEAVEEKKEESLLDLDFDPFKPGAATVGIVQSHSPISQTLPWDLWTCFCPSTQTNNEVVQPASTGVFNGFTQPDASAPLFTLPSEKNEEVPDASAPLFTLPSEQNEEVPDASAPTFTLPSEQNEEVPDASAPLFTLPSEQNEEVVESEVKQESPVEMAEDIMEEEKEPEIIEPNETKAPPEITIIPSVVIEPASNHEDEHDDDITTEVTDAVEEKFGTDSTLDSTEDQSHIMSNDGADSISSSQSKPEGFLYKAEVLHDFEAANEDELDLKRGDIVVIITSITAADQEAGWLTGVKETDWLQHKDAEAYKGLFPENFTRKLD